MLAKAMVHVGRRLVKDYPPMGREYFAARVWNPTRYDKSSLGGPEILDNERRIIDLIKKYGAGAKRTIEFGSGPGIYLEAAARNTDAEEIVGVDVSAAALESSRRRVNDPRLRLVNGDFWKDLELGTADVVVCANAIHHLGRVRPVIERLKSFVNPGGVLIGNVWTMDHYHEYQRNVHGTWRHLGRSALFMANAIALRSTSGRFHWGSYRSEILYASEVDEILSEYSDEILYRSNTRYITGFAIRC
ncbi:class I SAM-dependent methyltransferase [Solwaraspora sp. WMMA2056]|uniref:class I SAM-dependent methyltransferase n=1 Tax=Solwaraspora sp. WMMA2056 TaxID=3015161 RepID=UPI00259BF326|nr:class I SAM-dependent methyltransferase [Solwaraspora sp. WMMA2056]WJK42567.1 class I SAM-dependent methyltransferase [Solwaraspora sp. WMMA2056]